MTYVEYSVVSKMQQQWYCSNNLCTGFCGEQNVPTMMLCKQPIYSDLWWAECDNSDIVQTTYVTGWLSLCSSCKSETRLLPLRSGGVLRRGGSGGGGGWEEREFSRFGLGGSSSSSSSSLQALQALRALQALPALQALQALRALRALQALKALQALRAYKWPAGERRGLSLGRRNGRKLAVTT